MNEITDLTTLTIRMSIFVIIAGIVETAIKCKLFVNKMLV